MVVEPGLSAINIAPHFLLAPNVADPAPVLVALEVGFTFQAPPTVPLAALNEYDAVFSAPGEVAVAQADTEVALSNVPTNMAISEPRDAFGIAVTPVMLVVAVPTDQEPGSTSKGPPAVPSALTPPVVSTPENATIAPVTSSTELPKAKVKLAPSVPSATL